VRDKLNLYYRVSEVMSNMDLEIEYIFNTKQNKRCISIENNIFREYNHFKNGSFVLGVLTVNVLRVF